MERAQRGHNGFIEPRDWRHEVSQSEAHAFIKLILHTVELLVEEGEQAANVSDERLALMTSLSVKTIRKYRKEAADQGWLGFSLGDGRGKVTEYRFRVPVNTIKELAARLDAVAKGYPHGETFTSQEPEKVTLGVIPFPQKATPEGQPLASKGYPEGDPLQGVAKKEIPPTPPKEKNINNTPVGPHAESEEKPKRARQMPPGWKPDEATIRWARGEKIGASENQIREQFEAFRDFHQSKGNRFLNWDQAFQTWMRKAKQYGHLDPRGGGKSFGQPNNFKQKSLLSDDDPPRKLRPRCEVET